MSSAASPLSYDWLVPGTSDLPSSCIDSNNPCTQLDWLHNEIRDFSNPPHTERRSCNKSHKSAPANEHTRCNIVIVWLRADGEGARFYLMIDGRDLYFDDMHKFTGFKVSDVYRNTTYNMFIYPLLFPT